MFKFLKHHNKHPYRTSGFDELSTTYQHLVEPRVTCPFLPKELHYTSDGTVVEYYTLSYEEETGSIPKARKADRIPTTTWRMGI